MRYGFLIVGIILLVFAWYLFSGGMALVNSTNQCTSSILCSLGNAVANGGTTIQSEQDQGYIQLGLGGFLGLLGLVFVGVGFTGGKKQVVYQQPVYQQPPPQPQYRAPPPQPLTESEKGELEEFRRKFATTSPLQVQNSTPQTDKRFCTNCGTPASPNTKFCGKCGAALQ